TLESRHLVRPTTREYDSPTDEDMGAFEDSLNELKAASTTSSLPTATTHLQAAESTSVGEGTFRGRQGGPSAELEVREPGHCSMPMANVQAELFGPTQLTLDPVVTKAVSGESLGGPCLAPS